MQPGRLTSLIAAAALLFLVPASGPAQQVPLLGELNARIEEFNRLIGERRRAGSDLSAVEPLRLKVEAAFRGGDLPLLIELIGEGIARLRGQDWNPRQRFVASLTLEANRLVFEPNQDLQVSLVRMYPADLDRASTTTVSFTVVPTGPSAGADAAPRPIIISERMPLAETSTIANRRLRLPDGAYLLVAAVQSDGGTIAEFRRPIFAISDFSERIGYVEGQLTLIRRSPDAKISAAATQLPTLELRAQRLASLNSARGDYEVDAIAELEWLERAVESINRGNNPLGGARGEIERVYVASDDTLVPYRVYIPASYDPSRPTALVILLHGALGDERTYFSDLYDPAVIKGEADRRGWILAAVNGRGRFSTYRGPGEEDVFQVLSAVSREFRVEASRVYLSGHSMGGGGTWLVAAARPEVFAAVAPVAAGGVLSPEVLNPAIEKLKATPAMVVHGAKDGIAPVAQSRSAVETARKAGLAVEYLEVPDADHTSIVAVSFPAIMQFFEKHQRKGGSQ